jgi:hypothetical protein
MPADTTGGFSVVIDPQQWYRLKKELDAFDPELARAPPSHQERRQHGGGEGAANTAPPAAVRRSRRHRRP